MPTTSRLRLPGSQETSKASSQVPPGTGRTGPPSAGRVASYNFGFCMEKASDFPSGDHAGLEPNDSGSLYDTNIRSPDPFKEAVHKLVSPG